MLIIEGPDCSGKTTLCKKLLKAINDQPNWGGYIYSHFTRLPPRFDYYWGYVDRMSPCVVQDRFHMSEIVYSKVRGEPSSPLDPLTYQMVDAKITLMGGMVVLVEADPEMIRGRREADNRDQMYDIAGTVEAARLFTLINEDGPLQDYSCTIDHIIKCNEDHPYATDDEVELILNKYRSRLSTVHGLAGRTPPRL